MGSIVSAPNIGPCRKEKTAGEELLFTRGIPIPINDRIRNSSLDYQDMCYSIIFSSGSFLTIRFVSKDTVTIRLMRSMM